jgi:hypothetical protein
MLPTSLLTLTEARVSQIKESMGRWWIGSKKEEMLHVNLYNNLIGKMSKDTVLKFD